MHNDILSTSSLQVSYLHIQIKLPKFEPASQFSVLVLLLSDDVAVVIMQRIYSRYACRRKTYHILLDYF